MSRKQAQENKTGLVNVSKPKVSKPKAPKVKTQAQINKENAKAAKAALKLQQDAIKASEESLLAKLAEFDANLDNDSFQDEISLMSASTDIDKKAVNRAVQSIIDDLNAILEDSERMQTEFMLKFGSKFVQLTALEGSQAKACETIQAAVGKRVTGLGYTVNLENLKTWASMYLDVERQAIVSPDGKHVITALDVEFLGLDHKDFSKLKLSVLDGSLKALDVIKFARDCRKHSESSHENAVQKLDATRAKFQDKLNKKVTETLGKSEPNTSEPNTSEPVTLSPIETLTNEISALDAEILELTAKLDALRAKRAEKQGMLDTLTATPESQESPETTPENVRPENVDTPENVEPEIASLN